MNRGMRRREDNEAGIKKDEADISGCKTEQREVFLKVYVREERCRN